MNSWDPASKIPSTCMHITPSLVCQTNTDISSLLTETPRDNNFHILNKSDNNNDNNHNNNNNA